MLVVDDRRIDDNDENVGCMLPLNIDDRLNIFVHRNVHLQWNIQFVRDDDQSMVDDDEDTNDNVTRRTMFVC